MTAMEALWAIVMEKRRHEYVPNQPGAQGLGTWFYQKVVLSCDPSRGGDCTAVAIYYDADWVSFTRAREGRWRLAAAPADRSDDRYADCVYHDGKFYTVTVHGVLEAWHLCRPQEPSKEVIINGVKRYRRIHTRFLVSTPCAGLLQIRTLEHVRRPGKIKVEVLEVDVGERRLVSLCSSTALRDHAVFVGLNHSACVPVREFPELRPNCVYFTTPRLIHHDNFGLPGWRGVGIYDLE
uniref:KIB1-4 beta-propeller domain-containing protein n=1 Tax=Triticum urartu TaxID=4572 RepID=A0A8R7V4L1_TRIUA